MQNWRRAILSEDSCHTEEELSEPLGGYQSASKMVKTPETVGMIEKEGYWVPQELFYELKSRGDVERRLSACEQLVKRHTRKGFLHP
nr:Mariner Mos1 transposase [Hymenolepis microstoma]